MKRSFLITLFVMGCASNPMSPSLLNSLEKVLHILVDVAPIIIERANVMNDAGTDASVTDAR